MWFCGTLGLKEMKKKGGYSKCVQAGAGNIFKVEAEES